MADDVQLTPLTDILKREPKAEPQAATPAPASTEPVTTEPTGAPAPTAADKTAPAPVQKSEPPSPQVKDDAAAGQLKALEAERKKRQAVEKELEALRAQSTKKEEEIPDPLVDPKGYAQYVRTTQEVQRFEDRLAFTQELVIEKEGQEAWDAAEQAVIAKAKADPAFAETFAKGVSSARNPAKYAFEAGKALLEETKSAPTPAGLDIDAIVQKAVAAALAAQTPQPAQPTPAPKPRVPTSLADARSANPGSAPAFSGPTPLRDILKRKA